MSEEVRGNPGSTILRSLAAAHPAQTQLATVEVTSLVPRCRAGQPGHALALLETTSDLCTHAGSLQFWAHRLLL